MGIRARFICGGRAGRWRRAARCCSRCCCPIPATRTAPTTSRLRRGRCWRMFRASPDRRTSICARRFSSSSAIFRIGTCAANPRYLEVGRGLVKAAHGEEAPLVVDPFAGGGSIPLEALRLGCDAFASDLNPVACLILKVMLEDIPRHGPKLADELRAGRRGDKEAGGKGTRRSITRPINDGATPIAYLWARTVNCESPNCGAEIPLVRSFWLCKKASRLRALSYEVKRPKGKTAARRVRGLQPKSEKEVPPGNRQRAVMRPVLHARRFFAVDRVRVATSPAARRRGCDLRRRGKSHRRCALSRS